MIDVASHIISNPSFIGDILGNLSTNLDLRLDDWIEIAQLAAPKDTQFKQDFFADLIKGWNNFVKSGQVWALIIGATLGYLFRSVTSS